MQIFLLAGMFPSIEIGGGELLTIYAFYGNKKPLSLGFCSSLSYTPVPLLSPKAHIIECGVGANLIILISKKDFVFVRSRAVADYVLGKAVVPGMLFEAGAGRKLYFLISSGLLYWQGSFLPLVNIGIGYNLW